MRIQDGGKTIKKVSFQKFEISRVPRVLVLTITNKLKTKSIVGTPNL